MMWWDGRQVKNREREELLAFSFFFQLGRREQFMASRSS